MQIFSMYLISCYYPYTILKSLTIFIFCHLRLSPIHTTCCTFSHVSVVFPAELYDCSITAIFTRSQQLFWNQHEPFFVQFCHTIITFFIHLTSCLLLLWQLSFLTHRGFLCQRISLSACTYAITAVWKMLMKNNHANIVSSTYVKLASNRLVH